jgi:putative flippase GtrA
MKERVLSTLERLQRVRFLRYVVAGGTATAADMLVFVLLYQLLPLPEVIHLGFISVGKETPCLLLSFSVGLFVNFNISKNYVFAESDLRTRTQLVRFMIFGLIVFVGNYFVMRLVRPLAAVYIDDSTLLYPIVVRAIPALSIMIISYLYHKYFSFEVQANRGS